MKAYVTRVGAGPFPTEELDDGRRAPRGARQGVRHGHRAASAACGWFDAALGRYAARLNGLTELFVTKLDVL